MSFTSIDVGRRLAAVRDGAPLLQCITNSVVTNFTANVLLAVGAAPAMVDIPEEAGLFAGVASALLVNLGTPHAEQRQAMLEAAAAAIGNAVPWVLDPVAVGSLPVRTALAAELLDHRPTAIRGNPSEIAAIAGAGSGGRGTDSSASAEAVLDAARDLARHQHCVIAISGPTDVVTDGSTELRLRNGHVLLTRITGGGCALGALVAAFLAADTANPLQAVAAATSAYTIAAEVAAANAPGPGTFAARLIDALSRLDQATIDARLVVA